MEFIEDEEEFNPEHLSELVKKHRPTQIMLEYNGMWSLRTMAEKAPKDWIFYQIFMFVDHSKYQVYMNNMRQLLSDNFSIADIVVFNRCEKNKVDKKTLRRSIKALNPKIDMMFEYTDGSIEQGFQGDDEMPYDLNADPHRDNPRRLRSVVYRRYEQHRALSQQKRTRKRHGVPRV